MSDIADIISIIFWILVIGFVINSIMRKNKDDLPTKHFPSQNNNLAAPAKEQAPKPQETKIQLKFPQYEYKFVDLNLVNTDIISQIENISKQLAFDGWDYYRLETSITTETPGCLASIFLKAAPINIKHQYIVFRRPFVKKEENSANTEQEKIPPQV